jgi:hypothetical protein
MGRLVRMDSSGHEALAEWTEADTTSVQAADATLKEQLAAGYYAVVSHGEGRAEQVAELPAGAELVILRKPIAGG